MVRLESRVVTTGVLLQRYVEMLDQGLNRATNANKLLTCVSDLLSLRSQTLFLLSRIAVYVFVTTAFKALHDAVKDNAFNSLLRLHALLANTAPLHSLCHHTGVVTAVVILV